MSQKLNKSIIRQFWIINNMGLCLFHRSNLEKSNDSDSESKSELVSGMFSALRAFSNQLTNSEIKKFELNEMKILFFADKNLLFVVESEINIPDKTVRKKMDLIKELFIKKFDKQLTNFTGEISQFQTFEADLEKLFKKLSLTEEWGNELAALKF
jgi:hypothetical protein